MKKKILYFLLFVAIAIQFIRPAKNNGAAFTNQDITHVVSVPLNIKNTLQTSCYDCHSNHTDYPWYSYINPIGLWLHNHVKDGKGELNFSEFSNYDLKKKDHKLEEIAEEVNKGHMPLSSYLWLHQDAKLTAQQKEQIEEWVKTERQKLAVIK